MAIFFSEKNERYVTHVNHIYTIIKTTSVGDGDDARLSVLGGGRGWLCVV